MKRTLLATAVVLLGATLNACISVHTYRVGYGPPLVPGNRIVGTAPAAGYVWTEGYWDLHEGRWRWIDGKWQMPPNADAVWVAGSWTETPHGNWVFHPGHWQ
jgi:hypothetical protein